MTCLITDEDEYRFKCPFCGKKYVEIPTVEIIDEFGLRAVDQCPECGCDLILGIDQDPPEGWPG
jgi:transcription elongation factor Elf1